MVCSVVPDKFVKSCQVFDAQNGIGVNFNALETGCLGGGETNGGEKAAKTENFAAGDGELPVSRQKQVVGVGDQIELA